MNKIWALIKREYKETVFKKSFIFMTLLTPLLMIAMGVVPSLLMNLESEVQVKFNVIDQSGFVFPKMTGQLSDTLKNGEPKYIFHNILNSVGSRIIFCLIFSDMIFTSCFKSKSVLSSII